MSLMKSQDQISLNSPAQKVDSFSLRHNFPIIVVAFLFVASVALEVVSGQSIPRRPGRLQPRPYEILVTTTGTRVTSFYNASGKVFSALTTQNGRQVPLHDGTYRLTNGGAIRVINGIIVWDAFGVIDQLNKGMHPGVDKG
jgi:hypothetical protein